MRLLDIQSSMIARAGYDLRGRELQVNFRNGSSELYLHVPLSVARGLFTAKSAGKYFNEHIRAKFSKIGSRKAPKKATRRSVTSAAA